MATNTWNGSLADWYTAADWSNGIPTRTSDVVINSGQPKLSSGDAGVTVASISIGGGSLALFDGASVRTSGDLSMEPYGIVSVDNAGSGGSSLTVGGNLNGGILFVGNSGITSASTVTVKGSKGITDGHFIELTGNTSAQATLNVANAAAGFGTAGVETGVLELQGDSARGV